MRQIADWLEKLGLGQYARRFNENGIDLSVLPDLTDQDLEKLGVLLGHRRKLLRAIADLKDVEKSTPADAIATVAHAVPHPLDSAERRQVTVMFSDLVGSTELAARMDPEDLRDVISAYQQCVSGTVQRYDGFVAKYMGDGVLVYFGYPRAHEDDTDRVVRAGLELIAAVTALKSRASLQSRVGIATGLVVVGDRIGGRAGARHRRRDAEPRGAPAGDRPAEYGRHRRRHAKTSREFVRAAGPRTHGSQGHRRAGAGLGGAAGEFRGEPLRGAAHDRPDRARGAGRGIRTAASALVQGKGG